MTCRISTNARLMSDEGIAASGVDRVVLPQINEAYVQRPRSILPQSTMLLGRPFRT